MISAACILPTKRCCGASTSPCTPAPRSACSASTAPGKSTLLRILAGEDDGYSGEVRVTPGFSVGYLPQEPQLDESKDVLGNVTDGVAHTKGLLDRFEEVCNAMGEPDADFDKLLGEQSELQDQIDAVNGWDLDRQLEIAMDALRLPDARRRRDEALGR